MFVARCQLLNIGLRNETQAGKRRVAYTTRSLAMSGRSEGDPESFPSFS